jgi:hypothetical protein
LSAERHASAGFGLTPERERELLELLKKSA